jgi:hypothetical protein
MSDDSIPSAVTSVLPPDNELRIGTVTGISPFAVSVEGATINAAGRLASYGPVLGEPVALLRQDGTWLALGATVAQGSVGRGISQIAAISASANLNLNAASATVPGTTISFATAIPNALLLSWWSAEIETIGATVTLGSVRISIDGSILVNPAAFYNPGAAGVGAIATVAQSTISVIASPGSHTILLNGIRGAGADNQIRANANNTTLMIMVVE